MCSRQHRLATESVVTTPSGVPLRFSRAGRGYRVHEILTSWVVGSPWWRGGADVDTRVWRVVAAPHSGVPTVLDLRCTAQGWQIGRVRS